MIRKISLLLLLLFHFNLLDNRVLAEQLPNVSIFDVKQEIVIKLIPLTTDLEKSIEEILLSSPFLFGGLSMEPQAGVVLHIPFSTPVQVDHEIYPSRIREMYLFLERDKKPKALLFFAAKHQPIVVVLNANARRFMEKLKL